MRNDLAGLPRVIYMTGVDGSGKSFLTEKLITELQRQGISVSHLWLRFSNITSKPLLAICRLLGLNYYLEVNGVRIGYHDFHRSSLIAWLFILFQLIDTWLMTALKVWPKLGSSNVLICDRGAYDTLIDVMVDTKLQRLYRTSLGRLFVKLLPAPHKVLLISRKPAAIFCSRPDVQVDKNFDLRCELYEDCAAYFKWSVIDNNGTPEQTMQKILQELV
ncbi:hypothetical protein OR1_03013 [Geobacter sp. OR-1]|uniref:hypothetical protein n=1 Tax=Geobacter sp. OR-1 TaxID=1266765 RepID=UPI0005443797|nr:hypothetical protein [Geobacter sp. OR-1]GAM10720.1 hypothetical protein OR1_03013 [Geobacter sp. OR-1]